MKNSRFLLDIMLLIFPLLALTLYIVNQDTTWGQNTSVILIISTIPSLLLLTYEVVKSLLSHKFGVDLLAILSMSGALWMDEPATAAVIAAMTASGRFLENYARGRAEREMVALLSRVPRFANRLTENGIQVIPVESIQPGYLLLVKLGKPFQ